MADLIGRKPIRLYQAKCLDLDDVVEQREFAASLGAKIKLDQAWQLVIDKVKRALLRDIERHIQIKATETEKGKLMLEASIWIAAPEGGADG